MSLFSKNDADILDSEVLRRVLHQSNKINDDVSNITKDVQYLKLSNNENSVELSQLSKEVKTSSSSEIKTELKSIRSVLFVITFVVSLQLIVMGFAVFHFLK